ncbi:hypothetical protein AGMMS49992_06790 [Clostridia bacterium]|nr:hypothetical protein AGMMS49992_06790 [Clostridia bacterium]
MWLKIIHSKVLINGKMKVQGNALVRGSKGLKAPGEGPGAKPPKIPPQG